MAARKRRKINGRRIEKQLFDGLKKNNPSFWMNRYNENRRSRTPCDIEVQTAKYNVHLEVKATGTDAILKGNVRPTQIKDLLQYHRHRKYNVSIIAMYFSKNRKFVFVDIITFIKIFKPSRITFEFASKYGHVVQSYSSVVPIFRKCALK